MNKPRKAFSDATFLTSLVVVTLMLRHCDAHYTDQWAVQIKDEASAERVARDTNCIVEGKPT